MGIRKHDLVEGRVDAQNQGVHRHFVEPVFVPRSEDTAEDDGWVTAYVYDEEKKSSDVVILNAQDCGGKPVAIISLPRRTSYGFHGNWLAD